MLHMQCKQQRPVINKSFSKMADKFEGFEMLAEAIDIESDVEVEEEEVKGYDDYKETEFITEDFIDLDTLDYVDKNAMSALEEHRLGIPPLTFLDEARISKVKEDCNVTLTKRFICSKCCSSFERKKYFERHSEACHSQKQKEVKPKKGELSR